MAVILPLVFSDTAITNIATLIFAKSDAGAVSAPPCIPAGVAGFIGDALPITDNTNSSGGLIADALALFPGWSHAYITVGCGINGNQTWNCPPCVGSCTFGPVGATAELQYMDGTVIASDVSSTSLSAGVAVVLGTFTPGTVPAVQGYVDMHGHSYYTSLTVSVSVSFDVTSPPPVPKPLPPPPPSMPRWTPLSPAPPIC